MVEGKKEKEYLASGLPAPLLLKDQFPSDRASNRHTVQTNPSPLTQLCNSTHRASKIKPAPTQILTHMHRILNTLRVRTQPPTLKRKSPKDSTINCRVST